MKRPKLKKASKRVSCSKRYKIQKKVKEHNRKLKKELKKKGVSKRVKKDPGVPSIAPFREEVLREAELRRLKLEEEKEKKKQVKTEKKAQKRKKDDKGNDDKGKDDKSKDKKRAKEAEQKAKKARKVEVIKEERKRIASDKSSKKFICTEVNKVIDASDVIVQVLDARDPMGYRCPQLEEAVLQRDGNKKLLFALNKIDLVPKENVERWIRCLEQEFPVVAFKASTQLQDKTVQEKKSRVRETNGVLDKSRAAACLGSSVLLSLLSGYAASTKTEGFLKVGLVGFPNVGKSSLINSMKGMRACNAGVQRGMTKNMQDVHISKDVKMLDSPGIVASPVNPPASMALRSLQVEEAQESVLEAVRTVLKECDKTQIMLQYNVADFRNSLEFLSLFAKKRGFLQKGGVPNTEQAAVSFLNDWTGAKLSYYCKAPEKRDLPAYLSDASVAEQQKGWDLNKLRAGNEETLNGVRFPNRASSIGFTSKGPTVGLLNPAEVVEDKTAPAVPAVKAAQAAMETNEQLTEDIVEAFVKETEESETPRTSVISKPAKVTFLTAPVIDLSTAKIDDAYDFNTDFK